MISSAHHGSSGTLATPEKHHSLHAFLLGDFYVKVIVIRELVKTI